MYIIGGIMQVMTFYFLSQIPRLEQKVAAAENGD